MSKVLKFSLTRCIAVGFFLSLTLAANAFVELEVVLDPVGNRVIVNGRYPREKSTGSIRGLSFQIIENGANRIQTVRFFGSSGENLPVKQFGSTEFIASKDIYSWEYKVSIGPSTNRRLAARQSWITNDRSVLFLKDILPTNLVKDRKEDIVIELRVPSGWNAVSSLQQARSSAESIRFTIADSIIDGLIIAGTSVRQLFIDEGGRGARLAIADKWLFADEEARVAANEVINEYSRLYGGLDKAPLIVFTRFPIAVEPTHWEAQTRGEAILLVSSDMHFRTQSIQRLREQLRHEIFHLWIPGSVPLSGRYDWFYEGFALYQSLKTGVELSHIRFDDFLDTLATAYAVAGKGNGASLLELSKRQTAADESDMYARGLLVAFSSDIELLEKSRGRRAVHDLVRDLKRFKNRKALTTDANEIIKNLFDEAGLGAIFTSHVQGRESFDIEKMFRLTGIEFGVAESKARFVVRTKPTRKQKELLLKLGYNKTRNL